MKKLFHPGMIAIIAIAAITVTSCSRSANDLVVNERSSIKDPATLITGKYSPTPLRVVYEGSTVYPFINQPIDLKLGYAESNLPTGGSAVFYVLPDPEFANASSNDAILTLKDAETGDDIQAYNLISYQDAASYEIRIPDVLIKKPFMFAIVDLNDQYTDKWVTLHSEITVNAITSVAQLVRAFSSRVGILAERK
jgi:hypothetical protein